MALLTWVPNSFAGLTPSDLYRTEECAKSLESGEGQFTEVKISFFDVKHSDAIATFEGVVSEDGKTISDGDMSVNEEYRGHGFGLQMARRVIELHPDAVRIEGDLLGVNFTAFNKAFMETNQKKDAVMATPFYKIWSRLGFTSIRKVKVNYGSVEVVLMRPKGSR